MVQANGPSYTVIRGLEIPTGKLKGEFCDVALERISAVPFQVAAAIHTRPALVPMDWTEPLKTRVSDLGPEWQYWSRRFDRPPTPQNILAHVLTVLAAV